MEYSLKEILDKYNFVFKKKYGQNFIIDPNIVKNIISKSDIDKETLVIEVGPGAGALTTLLSQNAKNVLCYEIDNNLKEILDIVLNDKSNVKVIYDDFLKRNIKKDIEKYSYRKLYVVANLPYYITTPIITKLIEDKIFVNKIVIMIQKEVAERFRAKPGTKAYSSISVFLNYHFNIKKLMNVNENVFIPKPKVDSIVLELIKKKDSYYVKNEEALFKLIRDSFRQKRKTLRNNLTNYDLIKIDNILQKHQFSLQSRAEQIPIDVFIDIANNL